jgi:transposase
MDFVNGFDRDQLMIMDFEANVSSDSWARVVDWFVDMLPLEDLGFVDVLKDEGRPPYSSSDMLKLFMYGYKKKLRSSYQLQEACKINLEVIWLMRGLRPSARKIAYFRKDNPTAFKHAFRHFVLVLKDMDLISGETIAIDSFKIRAQNSLKNNFNQKKTDRHIDVSILPSRYKINQKIYYEKFWGKMPAIIPDFVAITRAVCLLYAQV